MSYDNLFFSFQIRAAWVGVLATNVGTQVLPTLDGQVGVRKGLRKGDNGRGIVNPGLTLQGLHSGI
jgi:hypothetical protein